MSKLVRNYALKTNNKNTRQGRETGPKPTIQTPEQHH